MVTIISAHPWHGSFNKAILDVITSKFDNENKSYKVLDLNKDGFNPVITEAELAVYNKGKALDPLVIEYQAAMRESSEVILLFPIWWGTMPAILKGFFDKVLLKDMAYNYENGWTPLLKIEKTTLITTSESPSKNFENSVMNCIVPLMLEGVGMRNAKWLNCEHVCSETDSYRKDFLKKVEKHV